MLGVVDSTSVLIETIPQSSGSHSVAADSKRNRIFVPQTPSNVTINADGNTTAGPGSPTVGALLCGSQNGCVVVYRHESEVTVEANCYASRAGRDCQNFSLPEGRLLRNRSTQKALPVGAEIARLPQQRCLMHWPTHPAGP